jgi:hypothetical protein
MPWSLDTSTPRPAILSFTAYSYVPFDCFPSIISDAVLPAIPVELATTFQIDSKPATTPASTRESEPRT